MTPMPHRGRRRRTGPTREGHEPPGRGVADGAHRTDEGRDERVPGPAGGSTPQVRSGTSAADGAPSGPPAPPGAHEALSGATAVPARLGPKQLRAALRKAAADFRSNEMTDRAAALTYYGVLSLFPALLVLVSLLSLAGEAVTGEVVDDFQLLLPSAADKTVSDTMHRLQAHTGTGSIVAVLGLLGAMWTSSGFVAAFARTANATYDVPEGRPTSRLLLVRLGMTLALMVLSGASALIVVFTGDVARHTGSALGIGNLALTVWSIGKWPFLVVLVHVMIALLYRETPNVHVQGVRRITAGSMLAVLIWMTVSAGFAVYVAHFASYDKTYGALAGVIVFLVWLWISNVALLFGLTFDAELARKRDAAAGPGRPPSIRPRDTRTWSEADRRRAG